MEKVRRKKTISTVTLALVLTIAVMLVALPVATAQPTKTTYAVIGAIPNPVGKGQQVLIWVGITDPLASVELGWEGLSVTIEKPDNTTETIEDIRTDATGGTGRTYTPDQVGTYYLQTHFPEQVMPATSRGVLEGTVMKASTSEKLALIVQEEPVEFYPGVPLPAEYWTRPIDAQAREWYTIAGNWLADPFNKFVPYNDYAPESAHILWTKPIDTGGLAGGLLPGPQAFECGDAYEGKWLNPVIIGGKLFYNRFSMGFGGVFSQQGIVAVDLRTGEELWFKNNTRLAFGQTFYWDSFNYHGVFDYLWETVGFAGDTWNAYDPFTGEWAYTMTNVPPGSASQRAIDIYGPKGEIFRYTVDLANGWMTLWNSSRVVTAFAPGFMQGSWQPTGNTYNATGGIEWNATIPTGLPGGVNAVLEDRIIGTDTDWMAFTPYPVRMWGISTEPGDEGDLLFNTTWTPPKPDLWINIAAVSLEDGVFVLAAKETRQFFGFSLDTGKLLWGPSEPKPVLDMFDITAGGYDLYMHASQCIAYGKLFSAGTSGVVAAYDVKNGTRLWTYEAEDPYNEILWGNNWPLRPAFVTDGKIYLSHQEHSPIDPKPRGAPFICLNTTTGEEIWRADGLFRGTWWGGHAIIGDSIIATMDTYDQRIYAIGKGPSAITVSIQNDVITQGSSVLIKGMVTDVSAGTKDPAITARFSDGVPAVADEHMSDWMLYVYKQFPAPMDVTGVDVLLQAMNSNGTITELGWVKSDGAGYFSLIWTPPDEDTYTIMAIFMGSNAYWPSYAQTALGVTAALEQPAEPAYLTIDLALMVAIVIAIVIGIVNLWALRKRK